MTLPPIRPITNGAGLENWLEVTKGWNICASKLGNELSNLTEGKSSSEQEQTLANIGSQEALNRSNPEA